MSTEAHDAELESGDATEADKVNSGALGTLVAVGLFAMISLGSAVTALVRHDVDEEQATKDADSNQVVIALKNQQRGVLNGPAGYTDRGKGLVSLPIDVAKQLVVSELARDPNSATPAVTGAASAAADAPPATPPSTAPGAPGKPAPAPTPPSSPPLTPTAASPGAKAPGPLKN